MNNARKLFIILLISWFPGIFSYSAEIVTWKQCVREAFARNPDILIAKENVFRARASKRSTVSALYPQISGSMRETTSKTQGFDKSKNYSYSISGSQLIFDGFKTYYNIVQSEKDLRASQQQYDGVSAEIRERLRNAFLFLLRGQELLTITRGIAQRRAKNVKLVRLRYKAGREHRGALLNAEANIAQARFEVKQANRTINVARRRLEKELGRRNKTTLTVQDSLKLNQKYLKDPDMYTLAAENPTLLRSILERESARYALRSSRASLAPTISVSGSTGETGAEWPPETGNWSAGISVSVPLFEGGSNLAAVARSKSAYVQARAAEHNTRADIVILLEERWKNLHDSINQVTVRKKFLNAAVERSKIAEAQYSTGLLSFDNWIIIEDDLVQAKKVYLDVRINVLIAEAGWLAARGETIENALTENRGH